MQRRRRLAVLAVFQSASMCNVRRSFRPVDLNIVCNGRSEEETNRPTTTTTTTNRACSDADTDKEQQLSRGSFPVVLWPKQSGIIL